MAPSYVVDTSVIAKWYLPEMYSEQCLRLLDSGHEIVTPDYAVTHLAGSLAKRVRTGELKHFEAERIIGNVIRMPIRFVPADQLAVDAILLSSYSARTFSESLFLVLALREKTRLVTADHRWHSLVSVGKLKRYVQFVGDVPLEAGESAAANRIAI